MKPSGIGGQAVMEGVMMKNGSRYAVAVRKPNHEIVVETKEMTEAAKKYPILRLPIVRGVTAFVESLCLGMKALTFSSSFFEEEDTESAFEKKLDRLTKGNAEKILNGVTILLSIVLAIGIFVAIPMLLAGFLSAKIESETVLALLEGIFRVLIFLGYIFLISQLKDIKRLFMYHGAEHKSINCIENGLPLTVANVRKQSREHRRCGTSFMLTVMVVSVIFFIFIRVDHALLRFAVRLLFIPVIAGVSYEFIRLAGRSSSKAVAVLSRPGMWLQALTTREPEDAMIEVAIQAVEAVFDWQDFLEKGKKKNNGKKNKNGRNVKNGKEEPKEQQAEAPTAVTAEAPMAAQGIEPKEQPNAKEQIAADTSKPLEIDLSRLFDIKVPDNTPEVKHTRKPKKDPMPQATEAVSKRESEEDDDILKALDLYFEFDGPKSVMEITDEEQ